jgi:hypothetical protein
MKLLIAAKGDSDETSASAFYLWLKILPAHILTLLSEMSEMVKLGGTAHAGGPRPDA